MGLRSWLGKLVGNTAGEMVSKVGSTINSFVHTKEEQAAAELAMKELELEFKKMQMDLEEAILRDRASAREMYMHDSGLQKLVAVFSLTGFTVFMGLQVWTAFQILQNDLEVNEFVIMTFSNLGGIFTALLFTLKDFLFGGSQGDTDSRQMLKDAQRSVKHD